MTAAAHKWSPTNYCLHSDHGLSPELVETVYRRVCRVALSEPGFCVVGIVPEDSRSFRRAMVELKNGLAAAHEAARPGETLAYLSAGRFDQQNSTKPHLDGGPPESILMLGYEPSEIAAELEISDYVACATGLGLTPREFLDRHNPMFRDGYELLRPYATPLACFDPSAWQIVVINNSSAPPDGRAWLGTLHTATIPRPDLSKRRVINSTMIAPVAVGSGEGLRAELVEEFQQTNLVRRSGYDRPELADDV